MKYVLPVLTCTLATAASSAGAVTFQPLTPGPLGFDSGTWLRGGMFSSGVQERLNTVSDGNQTASAVLSGAQFDLRADQSTGEVGAAAATPTSGTFSGGSANAMIFDLVTFNFGGTSSPQSVSYSVAYDGAISNTDDGLGSDNIGIGWAQVRVFDVTGLGDAFLISGSAGSLGNGVFANAQGYFDSTLGEFVFTNKVSDQSGGLAVVGAGLATDVANGTYAIGGADSYVVDGTGTPQAFSGTLTDTFNVTPGNLYAVEVSIGLATSGDQPVTSDMLNTAAFTFTNLSGGTAYSDSGVLPGTQAAPSAVVPVPLPFALLFTGIAGLVGISRTASRRKVR